MKRGCYYTVMILCNVIVINTILVIPIWAYVDPSAVTYIFQAVAAVLIAIGAVLTIFRHKISAFFKRNKEETKKEVHFKDVVNTDEDKKQE